MQQKCHNAQSWHTRARTLDRVTIPKNHFTTTLVHPVHLCFTATRSVGVLVHLNPLKSIIEGYLLVSDFNKSSQMRTGSNKDLVIRSNTQGLRYWRHSEKMFSFLNCPFRDFLKLQTLESKQETLPVIIFLLKDFLVCMLSLCSLQTPFSMLTCLSVTVKWLTKTNNLNTTFSYADIKYGQNSILGNPYWWKVAQTALRKGNTSTD